MDLSSSTSDPFPSRRARSIDYPPATPITPLSSFARDRNSYSATPSCIHDILPQPSRTHTIERQANVQHPDTSSMPSASRRPLSPFEFHLNSPIATEPEEPLNEPVLSPRERIFAFFGLGNGPEARERKDFVSLMWNLGFNGFQMVVIIALLIVSSRHASALYPQTSEWTACDKPLGVWDSIWVVKLVFDCGLAYWSYERDRSIRLAATSDIESSVAHNNSSPTIARGPTHHRRTGNNTGVTAPLRSASTARIANNLPYSNLYARLSILLSFFSFLWFLIANILLFSSLHACRRSSPHLWWLTFGIVAITYLMILELLLLGVVVFIVGPIIYLVWNIFLICIGHHPLQNPHAIKPEIGKLSKSAVDRIPLVLYIPPPPEQDQSNDRDVAQPIPAHLYPPKPPAPALPTRRFKFLRIKSPVNGKSKAKKDADKSDEKKPSHNGDRWEDNWELGEYPFVRLEGNRAACAICLMDFEAPKRIKGANDGDDAKHERMTGGPEDQKLEESVMDEVTEEDRLKLEDAGEGPQPLRLLACGHVFHQTCLDPWLTGISGRCPVCQRPVEFREPSKQSTRTRGS